jgi:hypothetical protein
MPPCLPPALKMTNDEIRMTKKAPMTNDEAVREHQAAFVIISDFEFRHSFVIRNSSFVIPRPR